MLIGEVIFAVQYPMNHHQRFLAAVRGEPTDQPPVTAWMHFGTEHLPAQHTADLHTEFFNAYDWDVLKVMADYRFAVPAHIRCFDTADKIAAIALPDANAACFSEQLQCLTALQATAGQQVPLLDSGYSPYFSLLRHIGHDQASHLLTHPQATTALLDAICHATCQHLQKLKALGVTGYFYATLAALPADQPRGVSQAAYEAFVRPYDLAILRSAEGLVRVLHAHGQGVVLNRLHGYPFEVMHLSDRAPGNPSLAALRRWTPHCIMGGLDESSFSGASLQALAAQMDDAARQMGKQGWIVAPGCVLLPSCAQRSLQFVRSHAETLITPT